MKKFYLVAFLLTGWWWIDRANAQYLGVKFQDGTLETREIMLLENLMFPDGLFQVTFINGSTESYDLSTVKTLYFSQFPTATGEQVETGDRAISVYPNPASDRIYIRNIPETAAVLAIYSIGGLLVAQHQLTLQSDFFDVSALGTGLYLIKINNQVFKFVKQ